MTDRILVSKIRRLVVLFPTVVSLTVAFLTMGTAEAGSSRGCAAGLIQGRLTGPEGPIAGAKVMVESASPGRPVTAITLSDSAGHYEVYLRRGRAAVHVALPGFETDLWYAGTGMTPVRARAAEIQVSDGAPPIDFDFGALDLRLQAPPEMDGAVSYCVASLDGNAQWRARKETERRYGARRVFLPALPPGGYLIQVFVGESRVYLDGSLDASGADTIRVDPGRTRLIDQSLTLRHLTGHVRGSWEKIGAHNPHIALYSGALNEVAFADADNAGDWRADFLAPGPVRIRMDVGSIRRWLGGRGYEQATVFRVPQAGDSSLGTFLESGVEVRLRGAEEWKPLRAQAELYSSSGDLLYQQAGTEVMDFPNLESGAYLLRILPSEPCAWSPQWFDRSPARAAARPIVVNPDGSITAIDCVLERGGVLRGTILRADGTPPGRLNLRIQSEEFGRLDGWETGPDGSFRIEGLPEGDFRLAAVLQGQGPERALWYPGTASPDSARALSVRKGGELSGLSFRLSF